MLPFLSKLFGRKLAVPTAFTPSSDQILAALRGGPHSPEMAAFLEARDAQSRADAIQWKQQREQVLIDREANAKRLQRPGELWLHTAAGPCLAVARSPRWEQDAANDNKLVLGHAGSGRHLMLARLARTAHEAGNHVVVLNNFRANPNNPGPLWMLTQTLGGAFRSLNEPEDLHFNPFWLPGYDGQEWRTPTLEENNAIATVLVNVLQLTRYNVLAATETLGEEMNRALAGYFSAKQEQIFPPCFTDFVGWVSNLSDDKKGKIISEAFATWLAQVSQPFVAGGILSNLLSATPDQVQKLVSSPQRIMHIEIALDERFMTEADTLDFVQRRWGHPAAQAQTRALMLLLHTLDMHMGQQQQRLSIVSDELHYDSLGKRMAVYLEHYLARWEHYNRELLVAWHERPTSVFSDHHPGAQTILRASGTQILVSGHLTWGGVQNYFLPLGLSDQEADAFEKIITEQRRVLVRRPGPTHYTAEYAVFDARLARADLVGLVPHRGKADSAEIEAG